MPFHGCTRLANKVGSFGLITSFRLTVDKCGFLANFYHKLNNDMASEQQKAGSEVGKFCYSLSADVSNVHLVKLIPANQHSIYLLSP